jgi:hypothetical protein
MATGQVSPKVGKVIDIPANAPPIGTATDLNTDGAVTVAFTAGSTTTGGPVFSYKTISNPGSIVGTGTTSPITVSGLTNSTAYTFTIAGVNATGTGPFSSASNSVTPTIDPGAFQSIATALPNGTAQTVTFNSIPQGYKHLQIRGNALLNSSAQITMEINSADTNQIFHYLQGTGSSVTAGGATSLYISGQTTPGENKPTAFIVDLHDYSSTTKNKTARFISGQDSNGTYYDRIWIGSGARFETTAITSLKFSTNGGVLWETNSTIALYGIKG